MSFSQASSRREMFTRFACAPGEGRQMISITVRRNRNYDIRVELNDGADPPYRATIERLGQDHFGPTVFEGIEFDEVMIRAKAEIDRVLTEEG